MSDPFIAEIRIFPFSFAPKGWAWCDGQLLPVSQNTALFALLGTTYGGNGASTFALPDLRARAPMHPGQGPGLTARDLGESGGTDAVTLLPSQLPSHAHAMSADASGRADLQTPGTDRVLARSSGGTAYRSPPSDLTPMAEESMGPVGSDQPHNNLQPYLTVYFNIALQGVFPTRP
ncbi:tail fiber protein [Nocardioides sp. 503]|uniref:phage tail protein n=1 Tax=Nocardioides sp. 503 TaxID=2508326 RepID=UPI00106F44A4|nr:tail fiber protein [Nocardioides sp. 503]